MTLKILLMSSWLVWVEGYSLSKFNSTNTTETRSIISAVDETSACSDWHGYGEKCYKVLPTFDYFDMADKTCQQHHGHLVSIHSEEENKFVYELIKLYTRDKEAWIGLRRQHFRLPVSWVDYTDVDYTNWIPSATPEDGRCTGMIPGGYWSGNICFYQRQSVCKRDKPKPEYKDERLETAVLYSIPVACVLVMSAFVAYLCVRSFSEPIPPEEKTPTQHLVDVATKVCTVATERRTSIRQTEQQRKQSQTNGTAESNKGLEPEELETIAQSRSKPRTTNNYRKHVGNRHIVTAL